MSGVFGYLGRPTASLAQSVAQQMGKRMKHHSYYVVDCALPGEGVALGRLSIGLFNRAPQPAISVDKRVWLCLTGEFYHEASRRAAMIREDALAPDADDAELALQVYLREGAAALTSLEGAFTLSVWDGRSGELLLVNDRYGLYPHYFAHIGGSFAFAPEIKGVLCAPEVRRTLNLTAIAEYVRFQQMLADKTWFEDVRLLPPASVLRYRRKDDQLTVSRYWDWDTIDRQPSITFGDAVEECIRLFQRSVDEMIRGPHRIGIYLSGGLDSRTILGFVHRQVPVTTINYGEPDCRDVVYAAKLAQRAGATHRWFPFSDGRWVIEHASQHLALTEGMHSWIHSHGMSTLAEARALIDVNLSGWDGGTIFGAVTQVYIPDACAPGLDETELACRIYEAFCRHVTWPGLTDSEAGELFAGSGNSQLQGLAFASLRSELALTARYPEDRRVEYFLLDEHVRRSTQYAVVFTRSAIEVRCPFFDYDFVSFMFSLPRQMVATPAFRRSVITRRMPHLARVPYERDNLLPHSNPLISRSDAFIHRSKNWINNHLRPVFVDVERPRLYADYEHYLRTDLAEWAANILFDRRTQERGLFDPAAVGSLWERHLAGKELWTIGKIAPLITIELVLRDLHD